MRTALMLGLAATLCPLGAQPKKLMNAQVQTRAVAGGLDKTLQALAASSPQPAWAAYQVPASRGRHFGCDHYWHENEFRTGGGVVHLEPPSEALVLVRFQNNQVNQIRTLAPDCEISAGGVPFFWLTGVTPADSVAALTGFVRSGGRLTDAAVQAIGLHAGPAADAALEKFLGRDQPESIRGSAARWLALTRGRRGVDLLKPVLASDPDERVRRSAVRALASSGEPLALDLLISAATSDGSASLRGEALRALGRQGGPRALSTLTAALDREQARDVGGMWLWRCARCPMAQASRR